MTAATSKPEFRKLARELAGESIVTKALSRFLEQIFEEVHTAEIAPLQKRIHELEGELAALRNEVATALGEGCTVTRHGGDTT